MVVVSGSRILSEYQEYGSFANAVDKPNGLCVLGSFIDIGPPHEGMTPLFNELLAHCKYK